MAKILVVDDEKIIVKGIRFSLLQDQMEVDCAYDGEQSSGMAISRTDVFPTEGFELPIKSFQSFKAFG